MRCPKCKLENPANAERCDCGYDFATGQMKESYLSPASSARNAVDVARGYDSNIVLRRWAATILDIGVFVFAYAGASFIKHGPWSEGILATWGLSIPLYFILMEGRWGATLGKLGTKIRVVDRAGQVPGYGRALVRMLLRLIEVNPILLGGIPAGIIALSSKTKQRLGDMAAGTYVLYLADVQRLRQGLTQDKADVAQQSAAADADKPRG